MKQRIHPQITFKETGNTILVGCPWGGVSIPRDILPIIQAFNPPADIDQAQTKLGIPPVQFQHAIDQLQDLNILVPDDNMHIPAPLEADLRQEKDPDFRNIRRIVRGHTMGRSAESYALYQAVKHVCSAGIEGDIVETGVWRGGNIALAALTLLGMGVTDRSLYLFDTFDWSWPDLSAVDVTSAEPSVEARQTNFAQRNNIPQDQLDNELVSMEKVQEFVSTTGYPANKFVFVKGLVQDTIPGNAPEKIAILRLDTDLYESTYHELKHLYPLLQPGGIIYIDDYPTEHGVIKAVEQYFEENPPRPFLGRVDVQGRIGIKP